MIKNIFLHENNLGNKTLEKRKVTNTKVDQHHNTLEEHHISYPSTWLLRLHEDTGEHENSQYHSPT